MDKEMINLIFSHIKDLGAEGADLFQLYIGLYYGVDILNGIMTLLGVYMLLKMVYMIISSYSFGWDIVNTIHKETGGKQFIHYQFEKRAVRSFIDKALEKHKKGEL